MAGIKYVDEKWSGGRSKAGGGRVSPNTGSITIYRDQRSSTPTVRRSRTMKVGKITHTSIADEQSSSPTPTRVLPPPLPPPLLPRPPLLQYAKHPPKNTRLTEASLYISLHIFEHIQTNPVGRGLLPQRVACYYYSTREIKRTRTLSHPILSCDFRAQSSIPNSHPASSGRRGRGSANLRGPRAHRHRASLLHSANRYRRSLSRNPLSHDGRPASRYRCRCRSHRG